MAHLIGKWLYSHLVLSYAYLGLAYSWLILVNSHRSAWICSCWWCQEDACEMSRSCWSWRAGNWSRLARNRYFLMIGDFDLSRNLSGVATGKSFAKCSQLLGMRSSHHRVLYSCEIDRFKGQNHRNQWMWHCYRYGEACHQPFQDQFELKNFLPWLHFCSQWVLSCCFYYQLTTILSSWEGF